MRQAGVHERVPMTSLVIYEIVALMSRSPHSKHYKRVYIAEDVSEATQAWLYLPAIANEN